MTRANFVKKARKDYPEFDIKKGDSYWWWAFAFGSTHKSKVQPKPSQLTQSSFMSQALSINESLDELNNDQSPEDLKEAAESAASEFESLKDEVEGNLSNMPESLQQGSTGELLQSRIDSLDELVGNLQSIDFDCDEELEEDSARQEVESELGVEVWNKLSDDEKKEEVDKKIEEREGEILDRVQEILDEVSNCHYEGE